LLKAPVHLPPTGGILGKLPQKVKILVFRFESFNDVFHQRHRLKKNAPCAILQRGTR
jgi:hypothetical protein